MMHVKPVLRSKDRLPLSSQSFGCFSRHLSEFILTIIGQKTDLFGGWLVGALSPNMSNRQVEKCDKKQQMPFAFPHGILLEYAWPYLAFVIQLETFIIRTCTR
jgi:hypothetical protein